uniref:Exodeoxyribonuclease 8 n=1 Tax=Dulem virus 42 TaxID=3145760 RepID=A0AAU8B986_9CAUD
MNIEIPYYEDNSRINNSIIGVFLKKGPKALYNYLAGTYESESGAQLDRGTMIHEYILQPEEFNNDYLLYEGITPSSSQQKAFCNNLLNTTEIEPQKAAVSAYKDSYSIVGKSEQFIASEATKMANTFAFYINALQSNKKLISSMDVNKCIAVNNNIKSHKKANELLNDPNFKEHHEFHINWEFNGVKCKSLLDCVKFDFDNKYCQIIDLKTTVKLYNFEESMSQYDYTRQLCFYKLAVLWYIENCIKQDSKEWTIDCYIIAIDNTSGSDVRVFSISKENVDEKTSIIVDAITKIGWHINNNKWDHSKEYYEGDGCESLNIN